jgi:hypothetical protein
MIAAVGLVPARRDQAAKLLADRIRVEDHSTLIQRADLAMAALELEEEPSLDARARGKVVEEALKAYPPQSICHSWGLHLTDGASRLEPNVLAQILTGYCIENPMHRVAESRRGGFGSLSKSPISSNGRTNRSHGDGSTCPPALGCSCRGKGR